MKTETLTGLEETLVEFLLRELSSFEALQADEERRVKSLKLVIAEYKEKEYCLVVSIGIMEARIGFDGQKISGSVSGAIERLIKQWIVRPLIQSKLHELIK